MQKLLNSIKQEPTIYLFRKAWKHAGSNRWFFLLSILLACIAHGILIFEPYIFGMLLNELQVNGVSQENFVWLLTLVAMMMGILQLFWAFHFPSRVLERRNAFWVKKNYQMHLFNKVFKNNLAWHSDRDSGDTLDKVNNAAENLFDFSQSTFLIVSIIIKILGTVIALAFFSLWISIGIGIATVISLWVLFLFDKRMIRHYKEMNVFGNIISAKIYDAISNVVTILILRIQTLTLRSIEDSLMKPKKVWWHFSAFNETKWFTGNIMFRLMIIVPLGYYLYLSLDNPQAFEIGTFSALYLYLSNYSQVFFSFGSNYEKLIERKARIQNADSLEQHSSNAIQRHSFGVAENICFNNVSFIYQSDDVAVPALTNLNLEITQGQRIALIGQSGSGKTTFLKVLHGLYENVQGTIVVDGKTIDKQLHEIDLGTTLVPQEPELFSSSVRENITFGLDYSDEQIRTVTDLAGFTTVADSLPKGFESKINEKGVNLSGGQKQRLALARALLFAQDKDIILLDESTSSVDPENENKIYQNIFSHFSGKTFIASIHKMNLLKYFDRIVMFENGTIVSEGTFNELLQNNTQFKEMWEEFIANQHS